MNKSLRSKFLALGCVVILIAGCSGGRQSNNDAATSAAPMEGAADAAMSTAAMKSEGAPNPALPRKIIYTGDVSLVCENLDAAAEKVEAKIKQFGGIIGGAQRSGNRGTNREATWTVRVPEAKFDAFIKSLPEVGELQSSNRTSQDVSEEFYDVEARLKNKRIEEERLVSLLKNATGKLTEILTVEKELNRVREEIERIEGRLRFLTNQTDLSTVTVSLKEIKDFVPEGPPTLGTKVQRSFSGSLDAMKGLAEAVLLFLTMMIPWLVIGSISALIIRAIKRRREKHRPEE